MSDGCHKFLTESRVPLETLTLGLKYADTLRRTTVILMPDGVTIYSTKTESFTTALDVEIPLVRVRLKDRGHHGPFYREALPSFVDDLEFGEFYLLASTCCPCRWTFIAKLPELLDAGVRIGQVTEAGPYTDYRASAVADIFLGTLFGLESFWCGKNRAWFNAPALPVDPSEMPAIFYASNPFADLARLIHFGELRNFSSLGPVTVSSTFLNGFFFNPGGSPSRNTLSPRINDSGIADLPEDAVPLEPFISNPCAGDLGGVVAQLAEWNSSTSGSGITTTGSGSYELNLTGGGGAGTGPSPLGSGGGLTTGSGGSAGTGTASGSTGGLGQRGITHPGTQGGGTTRGGGLQTGRPIADGGTTTGPKQPTQGGVNRPIPGRTERPVQGGQRGGGLQTSRPLAGGGLQPSTIAPSNPLSMGQLQTSNPLRQGSLQPSNSLRLGSLQPSNGLRNSSLQPSNGLRPPGSLKIGGLNIGGLEMGGLDLGKLGDKNWWKNWQAQEEAEREKRRRRPRTKDAAAATVGITEFFANEYPGLDLDDLCYVATPTTPATLYASVEIAGGPSGVGTFRIRVGSGTWQLGTAYRGMRADYEFTGITQNPGGTVTVTAEYTIDSVTYTGTRELKFPEYCLGSFCASPESDLKVTIAGASLSNPDGWWSPGTTINGEYTVTWNSAHSRWDFGPILIGHFDNGSTDEDIFFDLRVTCSGGVYEVRFVASSGSFYPGSLVPSFGLSTTPMPIGAPIAADVTAGDFDYLYGGVAVVALAPPP